VESSDDAILSKTLGGVITSWNAAATALFGHTPDEAIGRSITMLIPPELQHEEADILARIRRGERIQHYQTVRLAKDGRRIPLSLTISPVRDSSGAIIGASKIARDVSRERAFATEREALLESERAARSEAERLGHLKDEFLATLSHELRTPLNAILGWCALLKEPAFKGVSTRQAVDTIERNARAQAQIIDDLLDMSRIISGKIALNFEPLQVMQVVQAAVDAIRPSALTKGLRITLQVEDGDTLVSGDAARMQQVMWNLLTNAVKFTETDGSIRIASKRHGPTASIVVEDSGVGIAEEFLPNVFDRFRQADSGTTRRYGGLGLGLSIVRTLVELHGGTITVASDGLNKGSKFTISLPVREQPEAGIEPAVDQTAGSVFDGMPRLDGKVILVVDDDADSRSLLARVLETRGCVVVLADSGPEGLAMLATQHVDAILSDIGMPGMDGYQFLESVRLMADAKYANVPAIAVSAYARAEDRARAISSGYQSHIPKPYSISGVLEGVGALFA
jgi:PAS domain S-box-containing protein